MSSYRTEEEADLPELPLSGSPFSADCLVGIPCNGFAWLGLYRSRTLFFSMANIDREGERAWKRQAGSGMIAIVGSAAERLDLVVRRRCGVVAEAANTTDLLIALSRYWNRSLVHFARDLGRSLVPGIALEEPAPTARATSSIMRVTARLACIFCQQPVRYPQAPARSSRS